MKARDYPMSVLPDAPYNEAARHEHIQKLFLCSREPKVKKANMDSERLVFKVEYSQQLRIVNIRKEFKELVRCLCMHVGDGSLRETRLIIAHPVSRNCFIEHYGINFPVQPNAIPTSNVMARRG